MRGTVAKRLRRKAASMPRPAGTIYYTTLMMLKSRVKPKKYYGLAWRDEDLKLNPDLANYQPIARLLHPSNPRAGYQRLKRAYGRRG